MEIRIKVVNYIAYHVDGGPIVQDLESSTDNAIIRVIFDDDWQDTNGILCYFVQPSGAINFKYMTRDDDGSYSCAVQMLTGGHHVDVGFYAPELDGAVGAKVSTAARIPVRRSILRNNIVID